jgi:hypothetical protein|tara:strand:+ start:1305 stop:1703 length:399 start_codon:yes stop_codon:yes gene_type:complete
MIVTGNTFNSKHKGWDDYRAQNIVPALNKAGLEEQGVDEDSPPMEAYVNHGRWIVKCECHGAEKVWEEGLVMCLSCLNASHSHKYRLVKFPPQRNEIEVVLEKRRLPNRNWLPGETVEFLKEDNITHKDLLL